MGRANGGIFHSLVVIFLPRNSFYYFYYYYNRYNYTRAFGL